MSAAVVLITKDRDVQLVASEDADVVILDFQNMKVGDPVPMLSPAQKALLQTQAPDVLIDLAHYVENYRCENCEAGFNSVEEFKRVSWRPELLPNAMSRKYETAVGLKEALVWIVPAQSDSALQLTAEYWSEGRNALSCCFSTILVAEEEKVAISKVSAFLAGVEKSITETYAVRLWKMGVGANRDDACRNSCAS